MRNTKSMPWEKAPKEFSKQLQIAKQIEGLDVHDKIPCLSYHILRCVLMRRKIFTRQCFAFLHRQVRGGLSLFIYVHPTLLTSYHALTTFHQHRNCAISNSMG